MTLGTPPRPLAIRENASVKIVQTMLGHCSETQTLDRYGHLYPSDLDALAERLDRRTPPRRPPKCGPRVAPPSSSYAQGQVNDLALWWRWGDSNSTALVSSTRGQGPVGPATCWFSERLVTTPARCCPWFPPRLRTQHGPTPGFRPRRVADASGAPVLRDRGRSAGRARQGRCRFRGEQQASSQSTCGPDRHPQLAEATRPGEWPLLATEQ
jgi:hypothetical protein